MSDVGEQCKTCREGKYVLRKGPYGSFLGCNRFPICRGKGDSEMRFRSSSDSDDGIFGGFEDCFYPPTGG